MHDFLHIGSYSGHIFTTRITSIAVFALSKVFDIKGDIARIAR